MRWLPATHIEDVRAALEEALEHFIRSPDAQTAATLLGFVHRHQLADAALDASLRRAARVWSDQSD